MNNNGLSRRKFLQMMASGTAAAIAASVTPLAAIAQDMTYNEAPMLADLVASGALPPVAERLPTNPRVVTPLNEIGQYGGTMRRAFRGISDRWGPTKMNEEMAIEWDIPDTETINLVANYISEWTQNDDATEFTFTLREGLKWSDGAPFTTVDVQFWYDQYYMGGLSNKVQELTIGGTDMGLEVIDELSWRVTFPRPNPLLPIFIAKLTLGSWAGPTMAAPAHYLSAYIPALTDDQSRIDEAMSRAGVTTWQELFGNAGDMQGPVAGWWRNPELPVIGAWKSVNEPTNDPWLAERNPYYHAVDPEGNQLPYIDGMTHALFDDPAVFDLWVAQGQIDAQTRHVNTANFTFYKENEEAGNYQVLVWRQASVNALHPNVSHKDEAMRAIFDTAAFREALSIAINRTEINDLIYSGLYEPRQASPVTGSPEYDAEFETRWTEFDPDRANTLLDEMGMSARDADNWRLRPDGQPFSFTILHRETTGTPGADEMQLVEDYWRAIGLNVSQEVVERALYEERVQNGDVDVGVWGADRNSVVKADPGRYLGTVDDGPWATMYGHWYDVGSPRPKMEPPADHPIRQIWALWDQTRAEADEASRNALFQELLGIHKEHPYMIGTVGEGPSLFIVSNNVGNIGAGFINDDTLRTPGGANPATWYFKA